MLGLFIKLEDTAASKLSGAAVYTKHASDGEGGGVVGVDHKYDRQICTIIKSLTT